MVQPNEVLSLVLATGALIFIVTNFPAIRRIPAHRVLLAAFGFSFTGWTLTILEEFYLPALFNHIEHGCYAGSSLFLLYWCWLVLYGRPSSSPP